MGRTVSTSHTGGRNPQEPLNWLAHTHVSLKPEKDAYVLEVLMYSLTLSFSWAWDKQCGCETLFNLGCVNTLGSTEMTFHHDKRNGTAQIRGRQCYLGWRETWWETAAACRRCDWHLSDVQNRWQIVQKLFYFYHLHLKHYRRVLTCARDMCHGRLPAVWSSAVNQPGSRICEVGNIHVFLQPPQIFVILKWMQLTQAQTYKKIPTTISKPPGGSSWPQGYCC